jgi:GNAT superfamily N-acetyltransferase
MPGEFEAVVGVLDAAMLATDAGAVRAAIDAGDVLVAATSGRVLGALVLGGYRIDAVAVRRNRRGQGLGSALVDAALDRRERLVAEFDPRVRPFYESLGFAVEPVEDCDRLRGTRE